MQTNIVTLFPQMFSALTESGITSRAVTNGLLKLDCYDIRKHTNDVHNTVDDRPYGGGPGMVMMAKPLASTIEEVKAIHPATKVVYLSPQGKPFTQSMAKSLSLEDNITFIAGRYEGIDERIVEEYVDTEISIGDYVISGGELAVMVIIDAITRLLPGALGDEQSVQEDSFTAGLLDCPHYTRPANFRGRHVPEVLLSGNHAAIEKWRAKQALGRTYVRRPELLEHLDLTQEQLDMLEEFKQEF